MTPPPGRALTRDADLAALLAATRRVAVLGIKTEAQADQPAYYVAAAIAALGAEVVPVPVYYPECTQILGRPVFRTVAAVTPRVDLVDVFRRPSDLDAHFDDLAAARPKAVWLQSGIVNVAFCDRLHALGIDTVSDRCLMVEWRRLGGVAAR
ncbi:MAG: CoA-binding protein [Myxococcales bacterium]|nr:CoA-binding protein [Myxococcales bacterium]